MSFLACLPLVEADITAVLALDQRCLGGLWTRSGYRREIESDCSDLRVLVSTSDPEALRLRSTAIFATADITDANSPAAESPHTNYLAAIDPTDTSLSNYPIQLLGIGCLWAVMEEAHITTLAIEPTCQGQKLGQFLITELLLCGHRRGLTRATLEVRASNQKALSLYQKFGFREAGQRRRYYSDGENARILWRSGLQEQDFLGQIEQRREEAIAHFTQTNTYKLTLA